MESSDNEQERTPSPRPIEPPLEIINEIRLGGLKRDEGGKKGDVSGNHKDV
jgi:hypothetical protein